MIGISSLVRISRLRGRMMSSGGGGGGVVSPWLMLRPLYPSSESGDIVYRFYNVEDKELVRLMEVVGPAGKVELCKRVYKFVGSSHGFLASFDKRCGSLFLTDLVRRERFELPSVSTAEVRDVSRVLISCSPGDEECRALMIYGEKQLLAFCVPGVSKKWSLVGLRRRCLSRKYENISYSNTRKTFFCIVQMQKKDDVGATTELESWDLSDPASPRILSSLDLDSYKHDLPEDECSHCKYLVLDESSDPGQLFLVVRHTRPQWPRDATRKRRYRDKTVDFDVYEIAIERKVMSLVDSDSLDGLALFVGINHPFAVRPTPASRLQPNSIYFTDFPAADNHISLYGDKGDNGIFNYESRTFSPFYHSEAFDIRSVAMRETLSFPFPLWYNHN